MLTDQEIEGLALAHEDYGFGQVGSDGVSAHGFDAPGVLAFARAIEQAATAPLMAQLKGKENLLDERTGTYVKEVEKLCARIADLERAIEQAMTDIEMLNAENARLTKLVIELRAEAVRLNTQAVPEISTEHGPWVESPIHEGETYCKRCLVRSVFAGHKKCEPHIVSAPAAPQPAQQPIGEKDALLRQALDALEGFANITNDSQGVKGYHLNGDIAEWDEFDEVDAASNTIEAIRNHLGVKND